MKTPVAKSPVTSPVIQNNRSLAAVVSKLAARLHVSPAAATNALVSCCIASFAHTVQESDAGEFLKHLDQHIRDSSLDPAWVIWIQSKKEGLN